MSFLDEIAIAPDDPGPYLVYSDALMLRGDPRGDLISIQHALETAPFEIAADLRRRESDLLEANRDAWLGPLLAHRESLLVRWRYGFLHAARVFDRAALQALFETPCVKSTLAELRLGSPRDNDFDDLWTDCQPLVDEVFTRTHAIRRLHVCDLDLRGMFLAPPVRLPEAAKSLDALVVQTPELELQWTNGPASLRRLELRVPRMDLGTLAAVREWPNLESLAIWTDDASRIVSLLPRMPRLSHLALCGTQKTQALANEIAKAMRGLASVSLAGGTLTASKVLHDLASRTKLDVRFNRIDKAEAKKLRSFGAIVRSQRSSDSALTDRDELWRIYERVTSMGVDSAKGYRKLVSAAPDPSWIYTTRYTASFELRGQEQRDALAELVRETSDELAPFDRESAYHQLGIACDALLEGYAAETWLWQSVQESRWNDNPAAEVGSLGLIGTTRMRRGDPSHAAAILDRVVAYFEEHGNDSERAWSLRQRGNVDLVRSHYDDAEPLYRRALALYRKNKDRDNEGIVLSELSGVLWSRQDFDGAVAMLKQSISLRPAGSVGLGSCYYNLGAVLNGMDRFEEARAAAEQSLAIFRKHKRSDGEGQALSLLGELAQRTNRHGEAQELLEQALALHRARGAIRESGITLGNLARVALDRAQYAKAHAYAEEAVELHRECGNKYNEGMQLMDCADAAIGQRDLDRAAELAEAALVPLRAINNLPGIASAKCRHGYVAQLRGDFAEAERLYDEANADTTAGNYPELVEWTELYRAIVRAQQGRFDDARALVDSVRRAMKSPQGLHTLAMTDAVIARLAGESVVLPEPLGFDAHLIASFTQSK